ncbi:hypothetical protein [Scytonema sp. NUACC26]|uniref:hypothetical protein n=1 Tax=Scytonema sp. NUACC26 TaxID=3140176 RepID=UPI0034DC99CD
MAKVQQKVYFLTEQQRDSLLNYLQNRPYREVAGGVQFLTNAPTAILNMDVPEETSASVSAEQKSALYPQQEPKSLDKLASPIEELSVFNRV